MGAEHRPYHALLRDSDDPIGDATEVSSLLTSGGWTVVMGLIDEAHANAVTRLLMSHQGTDGMVFEQAEYARLLGFLSGLRQVRWAAEAVIEHAERVQRKEQQ